MIKEKSSNGLETVLIMVLGLGLFGSVLGLESNIQPFNKVRIQDSSFKKYLENGKEQYGDTLGTKAMALWTYPGAKIGAVIHNYGLSKNSKK